MGPATQCSSSILECSLTWVSIGLLGMLRYNKISENDQSRHPKTTIVTTLNSSAGTDYFLQEPFPRQSTTILRYIKTIVDNCNKFTTGRDGTTVESFDYVCVGEMDTARLASCACAIFRDRFLCKADSEKHHVMSLTKSFRL